MATKQISKCLFDCSLYERLTHLIALLPKQCIQTNIQQQSIRHNKPLRQPQPHSNNDHRRSHNRPSFQQNHLQTFSPRQHTTQQENSNRNFVDRRQQ